MPLTETLHVVAELAVAFAGFASLVSILGVRRGRDAPEIDALRLRGMLETSLLVAAFALVPILAHESGLAVTLAWRVSAGCFAFSVACVFIVQKRRQKAATPATGYRAPHYFTATIYCVLSVCVGALLGTTLGVLQNASFAYGLGLFAFLVYAGLLFARLVSSLLSATEAPRDPAVQPGLCS
jgi:hypothetical protein